MTKQIKETFKIHWKALTLATVVGVLVAVHGFWLFMSGSKFRAIVSLAANGESGVSYAKVFVRPTLFGVKNTVLDLKISFPSQIQIREVVLKRLEVRSSPFSRKMAIAVPEGILFSKKSIAHGGRIDFVGDSIVFRKKKGDLLAFEIDVKAREVRLPESVASNFSLVAASDPNGFSLRMSADSMKWGKDENSEQKELNFNFATSSSTEMGPDRESPSVDTTKIENLTINDITNGYGVSVTGSITDRMSKIELIDLEFKVTNPNSLINTLNDGIREIISPDGKYAADLLRIPAPDREVIVNFILNFVQFLSLTPGTERDTEGLRYYRVISDFLSGKVTVNGVDAETIAKKFKPVGGGAKGKTRK
ncbi:MAG: hypothetical protein LBU15_02845 [Rickettsiales bacterium]|jgi:hypothetical protein|nr:hypothetical protein [Rickettsiales bacterium]